MEDKELIKAIFIVYMEDNFGIWVTQEKIIRFFKEQGLVVLKDTIDYISKAINEMCLEGLSNHYIITSNKGYKLIFNKGGE